MKKVLMLILASDDKGGIYSKLQGIGSRDIPFGIDDADREFKDLKAICLRFRLI